MSLDEVLFVEVSQFTITNSAPQRNPWPKGGDYRVLIKHEHGTDETICANGDRANASITSSTHKAFIQLNATTSIEIYRARKIKKVASESFTITADDGNLNDYQVVLSGKPWMTVTLRLGERKTATQMVEARVQDTTDILEKEHKSVEGLERVVGHVKILVNIAAAVPSINKYYGAVAGIVKLGFEKVEEIPAEYEALKEISLECIKHFEFDKDAREVYTTDRVQKQLNAVMVLVVEALGFIFHYYSQSRFGRFKSKLTAPPGSTLVRVNSLTTKLKEQNGRIANNFLVELREAQWEQPLFKQYLATTGNVTQGKEPCIEGTRASILDVLSTWAQDKSAEASRLFWLYGVAGCGKSAVAVSISKELDKADRLGGSFFCRRDEPNRREPLRLFQRLAYCLTKKIPAFSVAVVQSLKHYDLLDDKSVSIFVEYALTKPLAAANDNKSTHSTPFIFIIDALDECDPIVDSAKNVIVADILANIAAETPWIKFIVTSRKAPSIEKAFVGSSIPMKYHDLFEDDAQSDVHEYLLKRFEMSQLLDSDSDLKGYVDRLAAKSGGLFIWLHIVAETIINTALKVERDEKVQAFLDQPLSGDSASIMAEIYELVLQQVSRSGSEKVTEIVKMIVGLLVITSTTAPLTISGLRRFLPPSLANVSMKEFGDLVAALNPVLRLTPVEDMSEAEVPPEYRYFVQSHHASFLDFCESREIPRRTVDGVDSSVPNPFWTDPITIHREMAMACLEIMKNGSRRGEPDEVSVGLRFNMCNLSTSHKLNSEIDDPILSDRITTNISPSVLYSSLHWPSHVLKSSLRINRITAADNTIVEGMLAQFLESTHSLFWLEALSLIGNLPTGIDLISKIAMMAKKEGLRRISQIAYEMSQFVEQCFQAISSSTPHLYISLAWIPVGSLLWRIWKTEFAGASVLKTPIRQPSELLSSTPFSKRVDVFAVSPDEKYVATGSQDAYVRLWNMRSGRLIKDRQIASESEAVAIGALAYEPGGSHILCVCAGFIYKLNLNTESLLDIEDRESITYDNVRCMAITHGQVAFGTVDGRVVVSTSAKLYSEVEVRRRERVDAIALSPDGSRLVYAADDVYFCKLERDVGSSRVRVYKPDYNHSSYYSRVTALAFTPDGSKIAIGNWHGNIKLVNAKSSGVIGQFDNFDVNSPVQFLTLSYGNRIIAATASKQGYSNSKDLPPSSEASRIYNFKGDSNFFRNLKLRWHYWAEETSLQIWNVNFSRGQQTQPAGHTWYVTSVAFSPDGKRIVSGSYDKSVQVWDAQTGEQVKLAEMRHLNTVRFVTFSPDGNFIASGGDDKVIRIWDALTGNLARVLEGHARWVLCGAYSPDGTRLVSGSSDRTLRVWNVETENITSQQLTGHVGGVNSVTFSRDGSLVASASDDSMIRLWDCKSRNARGKPLMNGSSVHSVAFSPDAKCLASGGADTTVSIWDVETRSAFGESSKGHTDAVNSVAFSPNGTFIFSASKDGTICCWEALTGNPVGRPLESHTGSITSLAVSPDGHRIVSAGSHDETIRVWDSQIFTWEVDTSFITCGHRGPDRIPDHIPKDGWIQTTEGRLLLWVPVEHRMSVCRLYEFAISTDEKDKPNRILWDKLCHGEKWTDIRHAK